jgi:hypothetical protein
LIGGLGLVCQKFGQPDVAHPAALVEVGFMDGERDTRSIGMDLRIAQSLYFQQGARGNSERGLRISGACGGGIVSHAASMHDANPRTQIMRID